MGKFGPRGVGAWGSITGLGSLDTAASPSPAQPQCVRAATPMLVGWGSPARGSHLVPHALSHLGRCQLHWWVPLLPRGTGQAHPSLCPCVVWRQQGWSRTAQGHCWMVGRACPTLTAPLSQNLLGLCSPVVLGAQVATAPWLGSWPGLSLVQPPGREGGCLQQHSGPCYSVPVQQSLVPDTVCQPNNGLVLGTTCQPNNL